MDGDKCRGAALARLLGNFSNTNCIQVEKNVVSCVYILPRDIIHIYPCRFWSFGHDCLENQHCLTSILMGPSRRLGGANASRMSQPKLVELSLSAHKPWGNRMNQSGNSKYFRFQIEDEL